MKTAYIIFTFLEGIMMLGAAVLIPIYITPGYYWWTAFFLILYFALGDSVGTRLDKWRDE